MMRWDVINYFIKKNGYKDYLEIGYYKGWSFDRVELSNKTSVDPNPSKEVEQENKDYGTIIGIFPIETDGLKSIWKMTSDDFFSKITPSSKWDVIFIDGLHKAPQVLKDFQNSIKHLSPGGIIILHDCNPPTYEHTTTGVEGCWTGDTYKTAVVISNAYPEFFTIDTDWGVGVLQSNEIKELKVEKTDNKMVFDYFAKNRKELINLISVEEFKEKYG